YQPAPAAPAAPVAYEPRPQHAPPQQSSPAPQGQSAPSAQQPGPAAPPQGREAAPAPEASRSSWGAEPPRSVAPEDDTAEADDPDLVDSALSGHELIVRELGATVVEEFTNEQ
ncbi:DNA polymerase III subunit gamma and tau, partial [Streptomyces sp. NE06-03C]|nr:DNA polymerase III subunit gamma and tau [Streptomyces sp. NE06-03C]